MADDGLEGRQELQRPHLIEQLTLLPVEAEQKTLLL
ncbi:hypothetical protein J2Z50_002556 [Ensifer mexicanus]|nr:hypothetical protein [Sinorhizobium mexicanum]